jgi:8-oxo-dGTP diphosphatase
MTSSIICTVDVVLLTIKDETLQVVLLRRDQEPFKKALALPGGYIHADEDQDAEGAAARVLRQKMSVQSPYLEQLATFSGPTRDPRGWSLSVSYYALIPESVIAAGKHPAVHLVPVDQVRGLPFDHQAIILSALERVRSKSSYSSLPVYLCGETFTLPQLQVVYESILGEPINKVSFRRKMEELSVLEAIEGAHQTGRANRPAQLYRLKKQYRRQLSVTSRGINPD